MSYKDNYCNNFIEEVSKKLLFKILSDCNVLNILYKKNFCFTENFVTYLGYRKNIECEANKINKDFELFITNYLLKNNENFIDTKHNNKLRNIFKSLKNFNLNNFEINFIILILVSKKNKYLSDILNQIEYNEDEYIFNFLSLLFSEKKEIIIKSLTQNSNFLRLGFVQISHIDCNSFNEKFYISNNFDFLLDKRSISVKDFNYFFYKQKKVNYKNTDFMYLGEKNNYLISFLKEILKINGINKNKNILIYGPRLSGRTEYVNSLIDELNLNLYVIMDYFDDEKRLEKRKKAYKLAKLMSRKDKNSVILFDNFNFTTKLSNDSFHDSMPDINEFVDFFNESHNSNVPTIWITNQIISHPKFIEFFDFVFEFPSLPRFIVEDVVKKEDLDISNDWLQNTVSLNKLPINIISKIVSFTKIIKSNDPTCQVEKIFDDASFHFKRLLNIRNDEFNVSKNNHYDIDLINCEIDIKNLISNLSILNDVRIICYGPPGTGKSLFGKFLSDTLNIPLIIKKASDIISKYIGETESNLANIFNEARVKNSILLIDEVDSFLQDRKFSKYTWEVTMVNEFLTQINSYRGILILTTNFFENLDPALMRRIDFKLKFDYLSELQKKKMISSLSSKLGIVLSPKYFAACSDLNCLTPGDFSNLFRQSRLLDIKNEEDFFLRLKAEVDTKVINSSQKKFGFVS